MAKPFHLTEADLIVRLRRRERQAWEGLYNNYAPALYGTILRIVKNDAVSEEVLQDVFLKIYDKIDTYDAAKGRLFTWMVNITRNLAIDKTRSKEIHKERKTIGIENSVNSLDHEDNRQSVDSIGVRDLLKSLPNDLGLIVDHIYLKGYTHSEYSEEFGVPLGTVKTRVRMAMKLLRDSLGIG